MTSNLDDSNKQLLPETPPADVSGETERNISWEAPKKPLRAWRLWVPLLFQTVLIAAVPAPAFYTYVTGKTVTLQTAPVDPYDLLRGYSQTLGYDISTQNTLKSLPGWKDLPGHTSSCPAVKPPAKSTCTEEKYVDAGTSFYVIMEAQKSAAASGRPQPWKPVRVSRERPKDLPANQVAIKGKYSGWSAEYGLETYYMPEDQREQINNEINQAQQRQPGQNRQAIPFVVEAKVDAQGNAVPVSLWVRERNYRF
ncbi:GDYXXLXY domain-containing protein [Kamptonema formosum]|uniref:GDYXXLXY domain-containing protein n=1 Tax=Kamptonema formosum TaxID=331992 RepID=UPI00034BA1AD|nr:GDYXXLXY domain-containing protein [Oscillatoria sp. PCC 10802]